MQWPVNNQTPQGTQRLFADGKFYTPSGNVPRLNAHSYEPCVQVSDEQRIGSVFVPMHWNDMFARSARVDALAAAITDPISGQPEFKHTPVYVEPYRPAWQGFVLSRERLELPEASYCASTQGTGHWRHEIAGDMVPENWRDWVQAALACPGNLIEYRDAAMGRYRAACMQDGRLEAVFFIASDQRLPEREWLASLFSQTVIDPADLAGLLAARPPNGAAANTGRTVCACFSIGEKTIMNAIQEQKLDSVEAVGACLKAGTGCGSCVPEIHCILENRP